MLQLSWHFLPVNSTDAGRLLSLTLRLQQSLQWHLWMEAQPSCVVLQVKEGKAKAHGSGYGGSGFKFNDQEEEAVKARKKVGQADICSISPGCTPCQRSVCGASR